MTGEYNSIVNERRYLNPMPNEKPTDARQIARITSIFSLETLMVIGREMAEKNQAKIDGENKK